LKTILNAQKFDVVLQRLAHQLLENHTDFSNSVIIGLQPRGIYLSDRIVHYIEKKLNKTIQYGKLDITFYRDDFANELHEANKTEIDFTIENKKVILIDDVLFTGRTIRSALDAIIDYGRPSSVELMTLIDRRFSRELPIQPDYVGMVIDSINTQKVKVLWKEKDNKDEVLLIDN
jgi:pyrimidine operon attenuation protein/uracil phosphoribosyltransferase